MQPDRSGNDSRPAGLLLGRARHWLEEQVWRTRSGSRWLLRRDLERLDRFRRSDHAHPFVADEATRYSQNGEDGILAHLFDQIGVRTGLFVEIGAADGEQNCTRALAEDGWSGLWIEGDPALARHAAELDLGGRVQVANVMVSPNGIVDLLRSHGVPQEFDLLVVDIDSSDYWLVDALLGPFRPTVLVVEVNGEHHWPWVQPRRSAAGPSTGSWDRSWNYGASLGAFDRLLSSRGYALLGCDSTGVNAFFVVDAHVPDSLEVAPWRARYVPPSHRPGTGGHPRRSPAPAAPPAPGSPAQLRAVSFPRVSIVGPDVRGPGEEVLLLVDVRNDSDVVIASAGETPYRLAYSVQNDGGEDVDQGEPRRSLLASPIGPSQVRAGGVEVVLPEEPGVYTVVPTLVQDGVAWRPAVPSEGVTVRVRG